MLCNIEINVEKLYYKIAHTIRTGHISTQFIVFCIISNLDINLTTTEVETHELYEDRRIFTKYVDCKALPNAGNKTYSLDIPSGFAWVDLSNSYVYSNAPSLKTIFPMNYHNEKTGSSITFGLSENDKTITFGTTDDWSAYNAFVVVKYYKY